LKRASKRAGVILCAVAFIVVVTGLITPFAYTIANLHNSPVHLGSVTSDRASGVSPFKNRTQLIAEFAGAQNLDGGIGQSQGTPSYLNYTCLSLIALSELGGLSSINLNAALRFVNATQNPDGGWGNIEYYQPTDTSHLYYTYLAVKALTLLGEQQYGNMTKAKHWVASLQFTDGSFGDPSNVIGSTTETGWAILTLNYTGGLNLINNVTTKNFLMNSPPNGVNYGNGGFLEYVTDTYPNTVSTWAAVEALNALGALGSVSANTIAGYISKCQRADGGVALTEYTSGTSEVWTALSVDALKAVGETSRIQEYNATAYLMGAGTESDLGYLGYTVGGLNVMSYLIVPLEVDYNSTTPTQGDIVGVNLHLSTVYLDPLTGIATSVQYGGNIAEGFDDSNGLYHLYILTGLLMNGSYLTTVSGTKTGFKTLIWNQTISVVRNMYLTSLVLTPSPHIEGNNLSLLVALTDREMKPITNASVRFTLHGTTLNLRETSKGVYAVDFTSRLPGHFIGVINATENGFATFTYSFDVVIEENAQPQGADTSATTASTIISGSAVVCVVGVVSYGFVNRERTSTRLKRYWGEKGPRRLMIILAVSSVISFVLAVVFMLTGVVWGLGPAVGGLVGVIAIIGGIKHAEARRRVSSSILSWFLSLAVFMIFVSAVGLLALMWGSVMLLVGTITYVVCPRDSSRVELEMKSGLLVWSTMLLALSLVASWLNNPYYLGGALAPPSSVGLGMSSYLSSLWFIILVMTPLMLISLFLYTIANSRRKMRPEELMRSMTSRRQRAPT
jgi:prenyltransferase beta subunit